MTPDYREMVEKLRTWLERERARPLYEQAGADKLFSGDDVAVYLAKLDLALSLLTEQDAELTTLRAENAKLRRAPETQEQPHTHKCVRWQAYTYGGVTDREFLPSCNCRQEPSR